MKDKQPIITFKPTAADKKFWWNFLAAAVAGVFVYFLWPSPYPVYVLGFFAGRTVAAHDWYRNA